MTRLPGTFAAVLRWGFGTALLLAASAGITSIVEVQRARREVNALVRTADRSTFLVGQIGRHVSRMRALAFDHLVQPERADHVEDAELIGIANALDVAIRELETLLQPNEMSAWQQMIPLVERLYAEARGVVADVRSGAFSAARETLVERVTPITASLQVHLDELARLNEEESRLLLAAADGRLARTPVLEAVLAGALLFGLVAIWWAVRRTIDGQRRNLERYLGRIEASNRDLDAFAGRIAHDLRDALSPVAVAAAMLHKAHGRPDVVGRLADQIGATVRRSSLLIDGLLAFSRAGHRGRDASTSVRTTIAAVLDDLASVVERVDAVIDVDVHDLEVCCAPGLLHIVVANLVGNALKFMEGRVVRQVRIAATAADDTGPGIAHEAVARIFEPFYRVPGNTAAGTGIGLATVQRIVEARDGMVAVDSEPGRGTTFRVRLPLRVRHAVVTSAQTAV
jgi:signal transduction histidine kinase